ncbi:alpha/beta fold hydrolase [Lactococcus termiticola]|uniref:AB hydrolase-1 domain-containing protein n=1 Tax=Lactococcus termiticola TaxID=2169526 RepID=A0A2R5HKK2_9LACT|nr:alpha/beta hydrolase [Lactococcus termiticola]GBG97388.1 hypothetical protein NtB2_01528 [Lactococcus termiticola]
MTVFTTNDGIKLNYHLYGEATKGTMVLIGGYSSSEVTWHFQLEDFVEAGYQVLTYDHRSHGASDRVDYGLTIHRLAQDLKELLDGLEIRQPILVGHSMGAATIMAFEELYTDGGILAVVTEDQGPCFLKADSWLDGWGYELAALTDFMRDFPRTKLTQKQLSDETKRILGKGMYPFDFRRFQPLLQNVILQDWRENLKRETTPHLFLAGGESPIFPPEHAVASLDLQGHPKSEALIFEGCGHILHIEDAKKFNQKVLDFLDSL